MLAFLVKAKLEPVELRTYGAASKDVCRLDSVIASNLHAMTLFLDFTSLPMYSPKTST